jgi:two-component system, OmpR family, copper resistance phosphate regulon response regulator CusR
MDVGIEYLSKNKGESMKILIIEDEVKVAMALKHGLESEHFAADTAFTGENGFFMFNERTYDLVILDIMLPGRNGLEILDAIRKRDLAIPVLILTARDTVEDRVMGLDGGADDYLVKPFAFPELLARIRAMLRRSNLTDGVKVLKLASLKLDRVTHTVTRDDRVLNLTVKEFELLEYLLQHQGFIVSREMLGQDVWHETQRATPLDNVIDVHIAHLRKKIDEPFEQKLLHTVRGVGFKLGGEAP